MNKAKLIIIAFLLALSGSTQLFSQSKTTTTEEEYNYVTKGYKVQIESGLDMKKGYSLKDLGEWNLKYSDVSRGFAFKGLYRDNDTIPCAVMAIYQKKRNNKPAISEYYCIPTLDAALLWERTMSQVNQDYNQSNANEIYVGMVWALMKFASQQTFK